MERLGINSVSLGGWRYIEKLYTSNEVVGKMVDIDWRELKEEEANGWAF